MHESRHQSQTFASHLDELRLRLFWWVISLIGFSIVGYIFRDPLQDILAAPLSQPLYYTSPAGGFNFIFQISLLFGLLVSLPILIYQVIRFLEPAMSRRLRKLIAVALIASMLLTLIGIAFAYFISLPYALNFLNNFAPAGIKALISTDAYMSFAGWYIGAFAILFQLPLLMLLINNITPLRPLTLLKQSRFVVVASFILAAIITPTTDPINQALMAGPIIIMYLISVACIAIFNRGKPLQYEKIPDVPAVTPVRRRKAPKLIQL